MCVSVCGQVLFLLLSIFIAVSLLVNTNSHFYFLCRSTFYLFIFLVRPYIFQQPTQQTLSSPTYTISPTVFDTGHCYCKCQRYTVDTKDSSNCISEKKKKNMVVVVVRLIEFFFPPLSASYLSLLIMLIYSGAYPCRFAM